MLLLAFLFLLAPRLLGDLSGALLRIKAPNLDSFAVEDRAFLLGVLRRDAIAVVHDPLIVHPAIDRLSILIVSVRMADAGSHQTQGQEPLPDRHFHHPRTIHGLIFWPSGPPRKPLPHTITLLIGAQVRELFLRNGNLVALTLP